MRRDDNGGHTGCCDCRWNVRQSELGRCVLGCAGRQNIQALDPGVHLVERGLDVGQCGEDWIFVCMVDMNSRLCAGDTNVNVAELIEASVSAGMGTFLLGCVFWRGRRSDRGCIRYVVVAHGKFEELLMAGPRGSRDVTAIKTFQKFWHRTVFFIEKFFFLPASWELWQTWQLSSTLFSETSSSSWVTRMYLSESHESSGSRWDIMSRKMVSKEKIFDQIAYSSLPAAVLCMQQCWRRDKCVRAVKPGRVVDPEADSGAKW